MQSACNRRTEPPENIEPDGDPGPFRSPIAQGLQPASQTIVHFHPTSLLPTQRTQDPGHSKAVRHPVHRTRNPSNSDTSPRQRLLPSPGHNRTAMQSPSNPYNPYTILKFPSDRSTKRPENIEPDEGHREAPSVVAIPTPIGQASRI